MPAFQVGDGNTASDGVKVGVTSGYIGFYGVTPVVRPTSASQAAVSTAAATSGSAIYGFTSAQANGIVTLLNQIRSDLVALGLLTGS
jgi:hypothetical protein